MGTQIQTSSPRTLGHFSATAFLASQHRRQVVTGVRPNTVIVWNVAAGRNFSRPFRDICRRFDGLRGHPGADEAASCFTGSADTSAILWELQTGAKLRRLSGHGERIVGAAFGPDGRQIVTCSAERAILWDARTGQKLLTLNQRNHYFTSAAFAPDGIGILTGSGYVPQMPNDDDAILWDSRTGEKLRTFTGHADFITSVSFSPDGQEALTGSGDETAKLWNVRSGENIRTFGARNTHRDVLFREMNSVPTGATWLLPQRTTPRRFGTKRLARKSAPRP